MTEYEIDLIAIGQTIRRLRRAWHHALVTFAIAWGETGHNGRG
jgi:hypothetical protein